MSTRATYSFQSNNSLTMNQLVTIYIHYDGYPEGAAVYFWNLIHIENKRGGFGTQFIRANDRAELTKDHASHGDTEFRYYLIEEELEGTKLNFDDNRWTPFFKGNFIDFINKYGKDTIPNFEIIKKVNVVYGTSYVTKTTLKRLLKEEINAHDNYKERFPEMSGNIRSFEGRVKTIEESLRTFDEVK